jgi:hypothetical protein
LKLADAIAIARSAPHSLSRPGAPEILVPDGDGQPLATMADGRPWWPAVADIVAEDWSVRPLVRRITRVLDALTVSIFEVDGSDKERDVRAVIDIVKAAPRLTGRVPREIRDAVAWLNRYVEERTT